MRTLAQAFEYGVILNGSQTKIKKSKKNGGFEYGVILNGSQTKTYGKRYTCKV